MNNMRTIFFANKIKFIPAITYGIGMRVAKSQNNDVHQKNFMDTLFYKTNLHKEVSGKQINDNSNNEIFHKCLNETMNHNHFTYKIGINEDTTTFSPHGTCSGGGLYVTNRQNIHKFLHYGPTVGNMMIPDDARCYLEKDRFKCDKLILILTEKTQYHDVMMHMMTDKDYCINMVKTNGCLIGYINDNMLKNNIDICFEAVKQCGISVQHISNEILKNNVNICLEAVKKDGNSIKYIDDEILKNNVNICMEAVKQTGEAIQHINNKILISNIDICMEAIKQNKLNVLYIDKHIIQSNDLLKILCDR